MVISQPLGYKAAKATGLYLPYDPEISFNLVNGGIIATSPTELGGREIHIAFWDRAKLRGESRKFLNENRGLWWAIIEEGKKSVINTAVKVGFVRAFYLNGHVIMRLKNG